MDIEKQLPVQVINNIEKLNENQLRYLNHIIVERLKLMNSAKALQALSKFNIGDIVSFDHYGEIIKGRIIRINQKTVSIITLDQKQKWTVAPAFLKKEESNHYSENQEKENSLFEIMEEKVKEDSINNSYNNDKIFQIIQPESKNKISRNAPCPCGSGKKYKHCCGK
jgi:hypothetical protein